MDEEPKTSASADEEDPIEDERSVSGLCQNVRVRVFLGAWLTFLTAASLTPLRVKVFLHTVGQWHNTLHAVTFFSTGLLILGPAQTSAARLRRALALVLFCLAIELSEALIYGNPMEWRDVFTDSLAIGSAWLLMVLCASRRPLQQFRQFPSLTRISPVKSIRS